MIIWMLCRKNDNGIFSVRAVTRTKKACLALQGDGPFEGTYEIHKLDTDFPRNGNKYTINHNLDFFMQLANDIGQFEKIKVRMRLVALFLPLLRKRFKGLQDGWNLFLSKCDLPENL